MKRWTLAASGLGIVLLAIVASIAAQEPGQRPDRGPRGDDRPQRKGMMGGRMMMGNMPMGGMMPMMMEMHQRHAMMESQWEATNDGVFVLRPGQLLKYDGDLKLVKSVDLPGSPMPMMHPPGGDDDADMPKMKMAPGGMRQMMAQMHGSLPARLDVTRDAVFVSRGGSLLKFSRDLELQKKTDLPETKPMMCPMCGHMMGEPMRGEPKE